MLSHNDLIFYYKKIFAMVQHHKYSVDEIESMLPYERDLYFSLIIDFIEKQEEQRKNK